MRKVFVAELTMQDKSYLSELLLGMERSMMFREEQTAGEIYRHIIKLIEDVK